MRVRVARLPSNCQGSADALFHLSRDGTDYNGSHPRRRRPAVVVVESAKGSKQDAVHSTSRTVCGRETSVCAPDSTLPQHELLATRALRPLLHA